MYSVYLCRKAFVHRYCQFFHNRFLLWWSMLGLVLPTILYIVILPFLCKRTCQHALRFSCVLDDYSLKHHCWYFKKVFFLFVTLHIFFEVMAYVRWIKLLICLAKLDLRHLYLVYIYFANTCIVSEWVLHMCYIHKFMVYKSLKHRRHAKITLLQVLDSLLQL